MLDRLQHLSDAAKKLLFGDDSNEPDDAHQLNTDSRPTTPGSFDELILVIGAAGAGSDALAGLLGRHPAIQLPDTPGEAFFAHDALWQRGIGWYRSRWSWDSDTHEFGLDHADAYTMRSRHSSVPERIHRAAESEPTGFSPKFIYVVRDPIDRIVSEFNRRQSSRPPTERHNQPHIALDDDLIDASRYAAQLQPYRRTFGRDAIRVLRLHDLLQSPTEVLFDLLEWLSAPTDVEFAPPPHRNDDDRALFDGTEPADPFRHPPSDTVRAAGTRRRRDLLDTRQMNRQFSLTDRQRQTITDALDDDVARLRSIYDIDTHGWSVD